MNSTYNVIIAGASGLVGRTMVRILEERNFPVRNLTLVASERSAGTSLPFRKQEIIVQAISEEAFKEQDIALFALESGPAAEWIPVARKHVSIVIDNSSRYRLDPEVPLVVPEVNPGDIFEYDSNLVANPNCSTIQMVVALKPLHDAAEIKRIVVATYQAVSGAGQPGVDQFRREQSGDKSMNTAFPYAITDSPLPHIASFEDNGYTTEENKMIAETRKIMHAPDMGVAPTCVRVPIENCHSEAVQIECERSLDVADARNLLSAAAGVVVKDDTDSLQYPLVTDADGRDEVFIGRIRKDESAKNSIAMWIVADNLRKGAATNAVQIAEYWAAHRHEYTKEPHTNQQEG